DVPLDVGEPAAGQVVHDADAAGSLLDQEIDQVGADERGAAGDGNLFLGPIHTNLSFSGALGIAQVGRAKLKRVYEIGRALPRSLHEMGREPQRLRWNFTRNSGRRMEYQLLNGTIFVFFFISG